MMNSISPRTYRRFILGTQGLWPGRRWTGKSGTAQAIRAAEAVQVDPVAVVAQNHDIALWGRVSAYQPEQLQELIYSERQFFDYGGTLLIYPIEEFPYWRRRMQQHRESPYLTDYFQANQSLLEQVRAEIRAHGPLRSRDLQGKRVNRYRSSKDSGVAMYYLWLSGELTIHSRVGRDRVYDFTEKLIPQRWLSTASETEAERFFLRKALSQHGLVSQHEFNRILKSLSERPLSTEDTQAAIDRLLADGELRSVGLEGSRERLYYPAERQTFLEELNTGRIPAEWAPLDTTTEEELVFLAPLEFVSARGRARGIFNFDYTWEIYKPAHTRKYGPYTLPVLYGDQLVARLDVKFERQIGTLTLNGFWPEESFQTDGAFGEAFARGLGHFAQFLEAETVDAGKLEQPGLHNTVRRFLKSVGIETIWDSSSKNA